MKKNLTLGHFIIAGISHLPGNLIPWHVLGTDTPVHLLRERFNPHDPLCISLLLQDDTRIGYIRREDNRILSALMDQGASLSARMVELSLDKHMGWPTEVRVEVTLEG